MPTRQRFFTMDEAPRIAANIANLPALLADKPDQKRDD
jgi:hypothetical protein